MDKLYTAETPLLSYGRIILFFSAILVLLYIFLYVRAQEPTVTAYRPRYPVRYMPRAVAAKKIFVTIPDGVRLANVNVIVDHGLDAPPSLFNVPVNPELKNAYIDATMVSHAVVAGKVIYKIELPKEIQIRGIILDAAIEEPITVYLFIESRGERVWEASEVLSHEERYHNISVTLPNIDI